MIVSALAVRSIQRQPWRPEMWALLVNVLVFIVTLNKASYGEYEAVGRITTGVILATLLCLPGFDRLSSTARSWARISVLLWFLPWYSLLPYAIGGL